MTGGGRSPARARDARGHPQREGLPRLEERAGGEVILGEHGYEAAVASEALFLSRWLFPVKVMTRAC